MTKLHQLAQVGQSVWYDHIRRGLITSGELQRLVDAGVTGVTSNPTIFDQAIAGSTDYDDDLRRLVDEGRSVQEIYEALALEDIARAADILRPVYDQTDGADGYVSIEVSPRLAHDTDGTIAEAKRLFATLGRPNVMVKVPATPAGIPAIEALIADGVNVNVTLLFSLASYEAAATAYIAGLEQRAARGDDVRRVASVASFFVSRVDTAVDRALEEMGETGGPPQGGQAQEERPQGGRPQGGRPQGGRPQGGRPQGSPLQGKVAIANARVAYARFRELFSGPRWDRLVSQGARVQRPLWASTSTKNPRYPDTLYVDSLIGPDTVNTVPPGTLQAFLDHGTVAPTLTTCLEEAQAQLAHLAGLGIDLEAITRQLLEDGVAAFVTSFEALLASIAEKRQRLLADGTNH